MAFRGTIVVGIAFFILITLAAIVAVVGAAECMPAHYRAYITANPADVLPLDLAFAIVAQGRIPVGGAIRAGFGEDDRLTGGLRFGEGAM